MNRCLSVCLALVLLSACNTTPESTLNEALPVAVAQPSVSASPSAAAASPLPDNGNASASAAPSVAPSAPSASPATLQVLKQGNFQNAVHRVSGEARILQVAGEPVLRLENFLTENGPDLYVYLVYNDSGSPRKPEKEGDPADFFSLGRLRSTNGSFNYEIPAAVDLNKVQSVTIWCQAFSVNFGYAALTAP